MKTLLLALIVLPIMVSCGKDGKNGANGVNGLDGIHGTNGEDGKDGKDGKDSITKVIKFCPNLVDSYGVQYSERGLCIDGKVYAVYSSNGIAALTEITYGTYVTTSPKGQNCTFTVNEDTCK